MLPCACGGGWERGEGRVRVRGVSETCSEGGGKVGERAMGGRERGRNVWYECGVEEKGGAEGRKKT